MFVVFMSSIERQPQNLDKHGNHNFLKGVYKVLRDYKGLNLEKVNPFKLKGKEYLNSRWKRAFDVCVALPSILFALPVASLSILVKFLEDGKNPFYVSKRIRKINRNDDGYSFDFYNMLKIRTMIVGAEKKMSKEEIANKTEEEDPRVTMVGRVLRRLKIDESIQLLYVLYGSMSVVGSRPIDRVSFEYMKEKRKGNIGKWPEGYNDMPKSLTTIGYIIGNNTKDNTKIIHPDLFYYKDASLCLDVYVLRKTIQAIIQGKNYKRKKR